ncbi:MAG: VTT domain-containing protein [Oscillospiraceae bacterium]
MAKPKLSTKKDKLMFWLRIVLIVIFVGGAVTATIMLWPSIKRLAEDEAFRRSARDFLRFNGVGGIFVFIGLQILQVVLAVIPGGPVQILAGLAYGTWYGLILVLLGVFLSNIIIYYTVLWFKKPFVDENKKDEKFSKYRVLKDPEKAESVLWILFMIPGTPKDLFTYLGPFVPVKAWKFFVIATFARIPGILTSTIAGQSFYEGEWWKIVFVFVITGLFGLLGIYLNNRIVKNKKKSGASKEAELC